VIRDNYTSSYWLDTSLYSWSGSSDQQKPATGDSEQQQPATSTANGTAARVTCHRMTSIATTSDSKPCSSNRQPRLAATATEAIREVTRDIEQPARTSDSSDELQDHGHRTVTNSIQQ